MRAEANREGNRASTAQAGATPIACLGEELEAPVADELVPEPPDEEAQNSEHFVPEPRRDLRAEATSLCHLRHDRKNSCCGVCRNPVSAQKANRRRQR